MEWKQSKRFDSGMTLWSLAESVPGLRREVTIHNFNDGKFTVTWGFHQTCHIETLEQAMQIAEAGIAAILNPPKRKKEADGQDLADI